MIVEIVFTGICAFVETRNGVAAIMPKDLMHMDHVTWMKVEDTDALLLPQGEVTITGTSQGPIEYSGPRTKANKPPTTKATPPTDDPRRSIRWVAKFPAILKKANNVDVNVKDSYKNNDPSVVALYYVLPGGKMHSEQVEDCVWRIKKKKEVLARSKHALAQEVVLETTVPDSNELTINVGSASPFSFDVTGKTTVRVLFANTTTRDIDPPPNSGGESVDEHFHLYYDMLDEPDYQATEDHRLPHRSKSCVSTSANLFLPLYKTLTVPTSPPIKVLRAGGANCPPAFMFTPDIEP
jgi:hypothetical protein